MDDDPRSHRERMLAGDPFLFDEDPSLGEEMLRAQQLTRAYNASDPRDHEGRRQLLEELLGSVGPETIIRPPFHCDFGSQIHFGPRCFVNYGLVALDGAPITLGADVQIGPYVQLVTAAHPLDPGERLARWESAHPISIGDNVWLGAGVMVMPGVEIGANTVVGAGSVVTKDLPENVLAVGTPARVIRGL